MSVLEKQYTRSRHDRQAPYWAAGLVIFTVTGVSTTRIDLGTFWRGYVLDMTGPAWTYILFRGLYTEEKHNRWTRFFTPVTIFVLFIATCFTIEIMQYFQLYRSTYDPLDFAAYLSLLVPVFLIDYYPDIKSHFKNK